MTFKPGQSGNPDGRPKVDMEMRALAAQYTKEAILKLAELMNSKSEKVRVVAINSLLDRAHGKPTQMLASDENMGGFVINIVRLKDATPDQLEDLRNNAASS